MWVGASFSNVVAGWLVGIGGYGLSHYVGGGVAFIALGVFMMFRNEIVRPAAGGGGNTPRLANGEPR